MRIQDIRDIFTKLPDNVTIQVTTDRGCENEPTEGIYVHKYDGEMAAEFTEDMLSWEGNPPEDFDYSKVLSVTIY